MVSSKKFFWKANQKTTHISSYCMFSSAWGLRVIETIFLLSSEQNMLLVLGAQICTSATKQVKRTRCHQFTWRITADSAHCFGPSGLTTAVGYQQSAREVSGRLLVSDCTDEHRLPETLRKASMFSITFYHQWNYIYYRKQLFNLYYHLNG